ncbi:hypothetical protein [Cohaesibacter celericrescens]|uniref:hypothetical protein n=1 Tax=Cohaesibacter celericrescens TaxID=2067669 RepID=UPI003568F7B7
MKQKKPTAHDWLAIRRQCDAGDQSIRAIANAHGLSASYLYSKRSEWRAEQEASGDQSPEQEFAEHRAMVKRLYHATDRQIRHLETRLENGDAAFDEKEARMLGTIARTLDKIMELVPKAPSKKPSAELGSKKPTSRQAHEEVNSDDTGQDQPNLDTLRQELALRLDRLQQGTKSKLSGDVERS